MLLGLFWVTYTHRLDHHDALFVVDAIPDSRSAADFILQEPCEASAQRRQPRTINRPIPWRHREMVETTTSVVPVAGAKSIPSTLDGAVLAPYVVGEWASGMAQPGWTLEIGMLVQERRAILFVHSHSKVLWTPQAHFSIRIALFEQSHGQLLILKDVCRFLPAIESLVVL